MSTLLHVCELKSYLRFIHFYVISLLLDLKKNCFRYIDYASMLFPMLCNTFECWFNLSISWTRWRSCKVGQFFQKITCQYHYYDLLHKWLLLYQFNFYFRIAGEFATILMTGLPVRHSFILIINIFS